MFYIFYLGGLMEDSSLASRNQDQNQEVCIEKVQKVLSNPENKKKIKELYDRIYGRFGKRSKALYAARCIAYSLCKAAYPQCKKCIGFSIKDEYIEAIVNK